MPDARAPSWPSRHAQVCTSAPRRAHGRSRTVVSWAGLAVSWPRPPAVSQPKPPCRRHNAARPCTLCRARRALRPCALCRACRRPSWSYREHSATRQRCVVGVSCARTWPCRGLGRKTALPSALLLVTIHHGVLRYSPCCQPFLCTIQAVYCDTAAFPQLLSVTIHLVYCNTVPKPTSLNLCNTMTVLQHKILPFCNTIGQ